MNKIDLLKKFNMTNNEAEVYLILAEFGTLTVKEIKEKTKVPRNKIYEVLDKLEKIIGLLVLNLNQKNLKL